MRACIFCNAKPVTTEHVLPRWLSKLVQGSYTGDYQGYSLSAPLPTDVMKGRQFPMRRIDVRRKVVCANCNGGWMSRLETACRPVLTSLVTGAPIELTPAEQIRIAAWTTKTALVASRPVTRLDPSDFVVLREQVRPPANVTVRVAHYVGRFPAAIFEIGSLGSADEGAGAFVSTLIAGQMVAQVIVHDRPSWKPFEDIAPVRRHYLPLCPPAVRNVGWPPEETITDEYLERFAWSPFPEPYSFVLPDSK